MTKCAESHAHKLLLECEEYHFLIMMGVVDQIKKIISVFAHCQQTSKVYVDSGIVLHLIPPRQTSVLPGLAT